MEFQKNNVSNKSTSSTKEKNSLMNSYQNLIVPTIEDSYSAIKRESLCLSFANNLTRLLFKYNGGHASTLYNYQLRIKNESAVRLSVKLKCTSPRHYEVRPCY